MDLRDLRPKKILVANIFGIGDVLFTTPLLRNLKLGLPDSKIFYLANRRTAAFLSEFSPIEKVFIYERDEYAALQKKSRLVFLKRLSADLKVIRDEKFDLVIDLSLNGSVSFLMWLAGIKTRTGLNYKNRSFFLNQPIAFKGFEERHVVEYYLEFLEQLGIPIQTRNLEMPVSLTNLSWATDFLTNKGIKKDSLLIGIVPGGGASWGKDAVYKRWSPEKYAKLADKIIEKSTAQIILMGDQSEKELCGQVAQMMHHPSYSACGETSISQFAALLRQCHLNVVNDGGPLHIAVAAGARTVSIFGPVDERVYGPYPPGEHGVVSLNIACRPCYRRFRMASCQHISCLGQIQVEDVFEKVEDLLKKGISLK